MSDLDFNPLTGELDLVGTSTGGGGGSSVSNHTILGSIRVQRNSYFSIHAGVGVTVKSNSSVYAQIFGSVKAFSASEIRAESNSGLRIKAV